MSSWKYFLVILGAWCFTTTAVGADWGKIMYPLSKTNIREKRSVESRLTGQLKAGEPVKADFLQGLWYAVFSVTERRRDERAARGYVYAPLLTDLYPCNSSSQTDFGRQSPENRFPHESEMRSMTVGVREISFKIAEEERELLFIKFDRFYTPELSGIQGKYPMIIITIHDASPFGDRYALIETGGKLIKRVRSTRDPKIPMAQIVLDMEPTKNFFVKPIFYEQDNTYCLEIVEDDTRKK